MLIDNFSCDYDVHTIKDKDYRFIAAAREGILTQIVYFIVIAIGIAIAYVLCPDNPQDITYTLGFPTWLTASVGFYILGTVSLLIYFMSKKIFSFEARAEQKQEDIQ